MEKIEYKDMFGLYYRVKQIRPTYSLMLNRKTNKVELIDSNYNGAMLTFSLPLTADILQKIEKSKVENSTEIFRKIEEENMKNTQKSIENSIYLSKHILF